MNRQDIRVGTAGWGIPKSLAADFSGPGSHLQRYARGFNAVEINSSFYRSHKPETYARWAASVPPGFRFAVKIPREITHMRRLVQIEDVLDRFLLETQFLGEALGPLLVQLPPSLRFDEAVACRFLDLLRSRFGGPVACEPRHPTWFSETADKTLLQRFIARVIADPAPVAQAAAPGGYRGIVYRRLHGSPRIYHSAYDPATLDLICRSICGSCPVTKESWCIFDNTALGAATHDARALVRRLDAHRQG
jgi:uncharacterized protein YecE (DUF72 family)